MFALYHVYVRHFKERVRLSTDAPYIPMPKGRGFTAYVGNFLKRIVGGREMGDWFSVSLGFVSKFRKVDRDSCGEFVSAF